MDEGLGSRGLGIRVAEVPNGLYRALSLIEFWAVMGLVQAVTLALRRT